MPPYSVSGLAKIIETNTAQTAVVQIRAAWQHRIIQIQAKITPAAGSTYSPLQPIAARNGTEARRKYKEKDTIFQLLIF